MRETWYVLEDGKVADPREVTTGSDGRLVHVSGALVAMRGDVPSSRGVDPDEERAAVGDGSKDVKPAKPGRGYKTRESKAAD